jgi:2-keto-4-pentenoate hydratase/2-oxohepta-3-ene-1,7-dioic acid hydratase in catechol pathway
MTSRTEEAIAEAHATELREVRSKSEAALKDGAAALRKESVAALEARTALVAVWENYANHWEERGHEAERLTKEWEKCFDELPAQYEHASACLTDDA